MTLSVLRAAAEEPQRPALVVHRGGAASAGGAAGSVGAAGVTLTFAALADATRAAMRWLLQRGVRPGVAGQRVALSAGLEVADLVLLYALFELGVPVVLLHPRLTAAERAALLAECAPTLVVDDRGDDAERRWRFDELTANGAATSLPAAGAPLPADGAPPAPSSLAPCSVRGEPVEPPAEDLEVSEGGWSAPPDDERPLVILYTSGSAGRPKGVILSRAAFVASAAASAANLGWRDDDRWLLCMPLAHVGGLSIVTRCLLARRTLVLRPAARFDPAALLAALVEDRVTLVSLVPTMLARLLELPGFPPAHMRAVLLGGAAAPPPLLRAAAARGVPVLTTYGLTEACSQVTTQRLGTPPDPAHGAGPALPGVTLRIVAGQVQVRSPALLTGYLHQAQSPLTADGFFPTGDLGALDEQGRLHLRGRASDLIITGGENVSPWEVEQALLRHPGVAAAAVFGVADPLWGELVAAALVARAAPVPDGELEALCRAELAAYRRPRRVAWLDALPLLANGKLDRPALVRLATPLLRPLSSGPADAGILADKASPSV